MAHAHEPRGHDMEEKAAQELLGLQLHDLGGAPGRVIFVAEADDPVADKHQARIRDRHAVGVAAEVLQHLLRAAARWAGVDDPGAVL